MLFLGVVARVPLVVARVSVAVAVRGVAVTEERISLFLLATSFRLAVALLLVADCVFLVETSSCRFVAPVFRCENDRCGYCCS